MDCAPSGLPGWRVLPLHLLGLPVDVPPTALLSSFHAVPLIPTAPGCSLAAPTPAARLISFPPLPTVPVLVLGCVSPPRRLPPLCPAPIPRASQERAIQEFIIGAVSAYKSGYSLAALALELKQNEVRTGDDALDASLRLSDREEATRRVWLLLIYLTLAAKSFQPSAGVNASSLLAGAEAAAVGLEVLNSSDDGGDKGATAGADADAAPAGRASPPPDAAAAVDSFRGLVADVTAAAAKGYTLDSLKLEQSLALRDGEQGLGAAEASVRSQFMRIIFLTARMVAPKTQGA